MLISSVRIAASSSVKTADAPCIEVPPVIFTFVLLFEFGAGDEVRDALREEGLLFALKSEISKPAAEGGGLGVGAWMASGFGLSVKALLGGGRLVM